MKSGIERSVRTGAAGVAALGQVHRGAADDDLDLVGEERVAVVLEGHVDDGVAAREARLLLQPAERERAGVVPGVGQRPQLGQLAASPQPEPHG